MKYVAKNPDHSVNTPQKSLFVHALKLIGLVGVVAVVTYGLVTFVINTTVEQMSFEQEKALMRYVKVDFDTLANGSEDSLLAPIVQKLEACTNLPYDVKVNVLDQDDPNAFAAPGGKMYVTTGFLRMVESENELAFVLGHELGHFHNKDHLRKLGFNLVYGALGVTLGDGFEEMMETTLNISGAKYSQAAELQADSFGLELLACAYGGVNDATKFFEKLNDQKKWAYFLSSHPDFNKRIQRIDALIDKHGFDRDNAVIALKFK
jgi:Zn-dependent protease with chaperone function